MDDITRWYQSLAKPSWQPPDWLFAPVWTIIFMLAGITAVIAWRNSGNAADRIRIVILFAVNLFFNWLWSVLFFGMKRPDLARIETPFLWFSILALIVGLYRYSPKASALIVPYLVWVTFASFLNYKIVELNAIKVAL